MKKAMMGVMSLMMVLACVLSAFAQRNPRGTATLTLAGKTVSVEYGRPSLNGRSVDDLLGQLKVGDDWRLGADTSTTFKTAVDLTFGEVTVPAGEYSLWMQKQEGNAWKLVFNKQHGQWGTQHDASQDLASVPLKVSKAGQSAEMVTIALRESGAGGTISIQWGTMETTAEFKAK